MNISIPKFGANLCQNSKLSKKDLYLKGAELYELYESHNTLERVTNQTQHGICHWIACQQVPYLPSYEVMRRYPELSLFDERLKHTFDPENAYFCPCDVEGSKLRATILLFCHEMCND